MISLLFGLGLFVLTGCWDRDEIEDRSTILGLAIDIAEEQEGSSPNHPSGIDVPLSNLGMLKVTAQLAIPGKVPLKGGDSSGGEPADSVWVVEAVGHTIGDAMQNLQQHLAHKIFLGHLKIVILSEEVARKGIGPINEYLRRVPDVRRTAWIAVNGDDAASTMEASPKMERVPTLYLTKVFEESVKVGKFPEHNLGLFWVATSDKGRDGYLPYIRVEEGEHIKIEGMAYFSGDKMVGKTEPHQIAYFNGLTEQNPGGSTAYFPFKENQGILFQSIKRKANNELKMKNGEPKVDVTVRVEGEIREKSTNALKLDNPGTIESIEKTFNQILEKEFATLITETQEKGSDIFGIGEYVRGKFPDYWDKEVQTGEQWKEIYKNLEITVTGKSKILRTGLKAQ
ncbi:Ger(x)C family spore germination protein [Salirhabdus sp. Marseille-P4669]|uniref:Ger(x)C family spore germination protein n=1 Tax=Salirhabdus sp. Marseille-P4669 TaxID=2042310 RepID=UPI001F3B0276|nr:Ger(x)C family spore germination protein [Salirhabdus sp. Marseille-P4669]